ncbi:hypothetical protein TKK_0007619 [Trichogramma kaykai]|uniref:Bardet-Biedl syndrome 4 n=1 Tax=Trichogramma kaykai TaxID=54128 RepID=A0ABD2X7J5_9HYME
MNNSNNSNNINSAPIANNGSLAGPSRAAAAAAAAGVSRFRNDDGSSATVATAVAAAAVSPRIAGAGGGGTTSSNSNNNNDNATATSNSSNGNDDEDDAKLEFNGEPMGSYNWMLYRRYVRHEFKLCKQLIDKEIEQWGGRCEYAYHMRGLIMRREGRLQEALGCFVHCARLEPDNVENYAQIAKTFFLMGDQRKALEALELVEKIMDPMDDWEVPYYMGECYLRINKANEAKAQFLRACKMTRNDVPYVALAELQVRLGHVVDAIQVYQEALTIEPDNNEVAADLGLLYLRLGDSRKAFQQFGKVLAEEPRCDRATFSMAYIMQTQGEFDVAFSKYKIASNSLMESWALWNNIGMCLYGKQKYVSAITCLKKAHYLNPLALPAACNLGIVYLATGQAASAAIYLCAAVSAGPDNAMPYMLLGLALKRLDDLEGAEKALEKAHALAPQDPQVLLNYAVIMDALKRHERAKEFLIILNDVMALIDVDPQITKMAKHLAAKLRISDPSSSHISVSGGSSPTGTAGGGGRGGIGGGDISPSLEPTAAKTTTTSRLSPMLLAPPAPPSPFADEISRTLSEDEV